MIPKFRAWHAPFTDNKFGQEMKYGRAGTLLSFAEMSPNDYILMQSTGLKDKNGVEIFEGDVLYYIPFESHINDSIVVFEKGSFCKKMLRSGKLTSVRFIDSEEYEVIGNVWDNQELLERTE